MGTYAREGNTHSEKDVLADWDPRMEDYLDRQSSTVTSHGPGSNFSRSANLARSKEMVREPCGVYVRNIPCSMTSESLHRMFSEHGKVLNVYIGKPRTEFTSSQITWAIIKVESMKDALAMISALHQKPPLHFKVGLSMTEEERQKRRREKNQEKQHQQEMEEITSSRLSANDCKPSTSQVNSTSRSLPNGVGRGNVLMSVRLKESRFTDQQREEDVVSSFKHSNSSQTPLGNSPVQCTSASHPKTKAVVEMDCGIVAVGRRQPRPCICCGAQGQLRCSVCKAWYCGKLCQVDDWYYHREKCSPPPPLEDADNEFESGRNISNCVRQNETKDTPLPTPQMQKPKMSMYESDDFLSLVPKSSKKEANVGQGNEKQDRHIDGNGEQEILDEKFKQQNNTNFVSHMQSVSPKQRARLFEEKNIQEPENKMQDTQFGKENIKKTENKIQDAQMFVCSKEIPNRAVDRNTSSANYRTIRNRTIVPSIGKLRRPHHAELIEVGHITNDDNNKLSKELCISPGMTFIEPASSSPNNINRLSRCDESTQTVPHITSAICMAKVSASCAKVSQENLTYSSSNSESQLTFISPVEKAASIVSSGLKLSVPNLLPLTDKLKLDTVYEGVITLVDSYKHFTAVIKTDQADCILGEAQEVLSNAPYDPNFKPEIGCIVAALSSSDNSWYRAYVHELVAGKYNVYYIDFGNMETVEVTKPLPAGLFTELPGLAVVATLYTEVDIKVQNQLQSIVMVNKPIAFKVVGKKSKSLKVSLLGCDPDGGVTDYIFRPWYSSLPLENFNGSSHISAIDPPSRLSTEHSAQEAFFQDKDNVDSVKMHCRWKSLDSHSQISPSKSAEFVSLAVTKASGINSVYPVDKLSDSVCDAENYQEHSAVGELCLKSATGPEGSNGDENKNIPFPGLTEKTSEDYSLCDSRTTSDTLKISKKKGNMNFQKISEEKEAPLHLQLQSSLPYQVTKKFWAKDLSKTEVKNGKEYTVVPVWVDDDNKLCVHLVTETSAIEYQKMTRNITQHCETGVIPSDIQVGELVCGFVLGDGLWCRAEVISVQSNLVAVHLVDFGNSETLLKKNIRGFTANFMQLPSICVRVKLSGISKENAEARRNLQALVESQLTLKMYSRGESHLEFELFDPQRKMFLNDELCSCTDRKTADLEKLQKGVTGVASSLTSKLEQENKNPSSISLPSTEAIKLPSFEEPCTIMRSSTPLQSSSPMHLPTSVHSSVPVELPTPDQSTTSGHPFVDAKRISSVSSGTLASPTVPLSDPSQKCASDQNADSGKTSIIKQDVCTTLISQTNVNPVTSQEITDAEHSVRSTVPMYDECKTTTLPISNNVTVVVLEAMNPHTIFVVPLESLHLFGELEALMVTMNEYCNSRQGCLYRPRQGEICLAKFSQDGKWYRAACVSPGQENALLIFIDFANTEVVLHSNILQIPKQFLELPCLALHCILAGVSTSDVKERASVRIRELMPPNSPVVVDVLEHNQDGTYTIANPVVTNTLLSEGLVKPI